MLDKLDSYMKMQVEGDIRYFILIHFNPTEDIPLKIKYIDSGGNFHSIGFTHRGMITFDD